MTAGHQPHADLVWFKSSYSGGNATECVETALVPGGVLIRDSKRPDSARVAVSTSAWTWFITSAVQRSQSAMHQ
ncbi:DUF397 domain-containing protein [Streptomyces sp. NBC_00557]|uniref:DUF397 domain-containing protein n=1 Tax=Streptomyces sp. NBC_00557 TaxID=2975776 RepID=UPI002E824B68|nr:DUF397 domain-containing protein [Streptomyces sp. NBC_00557]WUC36731.1 DUF397 domain-containing protein [Streptomyces sp. NBC_00557]